MAVIFFSFFSNIKSFNSIREFTTALATAAFEKSTLNNLNFTT
jgi:hypothetical protein